MGRIHPEIYFFGAGVAEGRAEMRNLLGGKGANLAEMARLKLPVPPGFTISTQVCNYFYDHAHKYPKGLTEGVAKSVARVEKALGRKFGDAKNPLLVSVRSGARVSMPGMMDTVLNLGLTDETVKGLTEISGSARFAWDSYRRFCQMFGDVVLKLKPENKNDPDPFEEIIDHKKAARGVTNDTDLNVDDLQELVGEFRALIRSRVGRDIPQDPREQLWMAIGAVFDSWHNDRAITYRKINNIPGDWGTAVTVQSMVFGNLGDDCATGVAFTRDPGTGEKGIYGEFLPNAQGEDVVAGIRTGRQISLKAGRAWAARAGISEAERVAQYSTLEESFPDVYKQFLKIADRLEKHFRDTQDMEFTIERNRLFMLQTRNGKRTAQAAVRIAVDMADEKLIDRKTALKRVEPEQLEQFLHPRLDPSSKKHVIARGLPASPGAVNGEVVFSADEAVAVAEAGRKVILVRMETSPEDIHGMQVAEGILTARGGMTSHAAVVARGMGKSCVAGVLGAGNRLRRGHAVGQRLGDTSRRVHHARRIGGRSYRRARADGRSRDAVVLQKIYVVGGRRAQAGSARQRRHAQRREDRARFRRRGNRAVPHRAYVLRSRANLGRARNDHGGERDPARARAGENPADAARGFRRNPEGDAGAAGHDSSARSAAA